MVHFFGRNDARAERRGRTYYIDIGKGQSGTSFVSNSARKGTASVAHFRKRHLFQGTSSFERRPKKKRLLAQSEILNGFGRTAETVLFGLKAQGIFQRGGATLGKQGIAGHVRKPMQL